MIDPNGAYGALTLAIMQRHACGELIAIGKLESALSSIEEGEDSYLTAAQKLQLPVAHISTACDVDAADLLSCII